MYGRLEYWEDRYTSGVVGYGHAKSVQSNEWYLQYPALQGLLNEYLPKSAKILMLGCGLSLLAEDMITDGFESILAVDYSETCIQRMQSQFGGNHKQGAGVEYQVMNVTDLHLKDCTFDAVLDKATLDCLMNCEDGPGEVHAMLKEAHRVLEIGGRFFCISHSGPEDRMLVLGAEGLLWHLLEHVVLHKNMAEFYAYIFEKTA